MVSDTPVDKYENNCMYTHVFSHTPVDSHVVSHTISVDSHVVSHTGVSWFHTPDVKISN